MKIIKIALSKIPCSPKHGAPSCYENYDVRDNIHNKLRSYLPASLEGQPPQPLCGERVPKGANHAKLSLV